LPLIDHLYEENDAIAQVQNCWRQRRVVRSIRRHVREIFVTQVAAKNIQKWWRRVKSTHDFLSFTSCERVYSEESIEVLEVCVCSILPKRSYPSPLPSLLSLEELEWELQQQDYYAQYANIRPERASFACHMRIHLQRITSVLFSPREEHPLSGIV
jgi:hypothetical protein